jgi:hypothetical protein
LQRIVATLESKYKCTDGITPCTIETITSLKDVMVDCLHMESTFYSPIICHSLAKKDAWEATYVPLLRWFNLEVAERFKWRRLNGIDMRTSGFRENTTTIKGGVLIIPTELDYESIGVLKELHVVNSVGPAQPSKNGLRS